MCCWAYRNRKFSNNIFPFHTCQLEPFNIIKYQLEPCVSDHHPIKKWKTIFFAFVKLCIWKTLRTYLYTFNFNIGGKLEFTSLDTGKTKGHLFYLWDTNKLKIIKVAKWMKDENVNQHQHMDNSKCFLYFLFGSFSKTQMSKKRKVQEPAKKNFLPITFLPLFVEVENYSTFK